LPDTFGIVGAAAVMALTFSAGASISAPLSSEVRRHRGHRDTFLARVASRWTVRSGVLLFFRRVLGEAFSDIVAILAASFGATWATSFGCLRLRVNHLAQLLALPDAVAHLTGLDRGGGTTAGPEGSGFGFSELCLLSMARE
jgi:hypothetical protein